MSFDFQKTLGQRRRGRKISSDVPSLSLGRSSAAVLAALMRIRDV